MIRRVLKWAVALGAALAIGWAVVAVGQTYFVPDPNPHIHGQVLAGSLNNLHVCHEHRTDGWFEGSPDIPGRRGPTHNHTAADNEPACSTDDKVYQSRGTSQVEATTTAAPTTAAPTTVAATTTATTSAPSTTAAPRDDVFIGQHFHWPEACHTHDSQGWSYRELSDDHRHPDAGPDEPVLAQHGHSFYGTEGTWRDCYANDPEGYDPEDYSDFQNPHTHDGDSTRTPVKTGPEPADPTICDNGEWPAEGEECPVATDVELAVGGDAVSVNAANPAHVSEAHEEFLEASKELRVAQAKYEAALAAYLALLVEEATQ